MKRTVLMFSVALLATSLSGQNRWNFSTGGTFSSFDTDLMEAYGFENFRSNYILAGGTADSEAKNSLKGGGFLAVEYDFMISKKAFIKTGMRYTTLGDNFAFETRDIIYTNGYGSETNGKYKWRPRLDYLAIPLNIGVRPSEKVAIYGGLSPSINVKNVVRTNKFTGPADDLDEKWDATSDVVKATPVVLFANAGISYYAQDGATFFDLRVSRSLGHVYDDSTVNPIFSEAGAWNVEVGLGLFIWKKSKKFGAIE
jgi:hypothetical protein